MMMRAGLRAKEEGSVFRDAGDANNGRHDAGRRVGS